MDIQGVTPGATAPMEIPQSRGQSQIRGLSPQSSMQAAEARPSDESNPFQKGRANAGDPMQIESYSPPLELYTLSSTECPATHSPHRKSLSLVIEEWKSKKPQIVLKERTLPDGTIEKGYFRHDLLHMGTRFKNDIYTFFKTKNYFGENKFTLTYEQSSIQFQEVWLMTSDQPQLRLVEGTYPEFAFYFGDSLEILFKLAKTAKNGKCMAKVFQHLNNNISLKDFVEYLQKPNEGLNGLLPIFSIADDSLRAIVELAEQRSIWINLDLYDIMGERTLRQKLTPERGSESAPPK